MSFGPKPASSHYHPIPLYHRPISQQQPRPLNTATTSSTQPPLAQSAHFYTDGRGHFQTLPPPASSRNGLNATQPITTKLRGGSAGLNGPREIVRELMYTPLASSSSVSARSQLNRTQPLERGIVGNSISATPTQHDATISSTNPIMPPPWQSYRGPVAGVHRNGQPPRVPLNSTRPQSSFAAIRPQPSPYNIITGVDRNPVPTSPIRGWDEPTAMTSISSVNGGGRNGPAPAARPVIVDQPSGGSRVYQPVMDADTMNTSHVLASQRSGRGSAAQRSQSVDRGSVKSGRLPYGSNGYANGGPAEYSNFEPASSSSSLSASSNRFNQTQSFAHAPIIMDSSRSSNLFSSTGHGFGASQSLNHTIDLSSTRNPFQASNGLSSTQPITTSRPDTAASSSDDGASFLEVGIAEDPNPRFRPTMEDAHIIKVGQEWIDDEAASLNTTRNKTAYGATTRRPYEVTRKPGSVGSPAAAKGASAKSGYFAIYDGHGGREAVDYIERNLHKQLARQLKTGQAPQAALEAAFLETDAAMQATRQYQDSGSTVASALLRPSVSRAGQRDLFVANVGDARAVVAVGNGSNGHNSVAPLQAVRLSKDHTPNDPAEAERVRRAGGAVFRGRVDGQLAVSRAIGDHSLKRSGVSAQPHQHHLPLTKDHKFVIVACDGLWDVLSDSEAVNLISGIKDPNRAADKLVKTAMQRGTTDNVSAMVIRLQK